MTKRFSKNNHYCVVHFTTDHDDEPIVKTNKHFFLFMGGRFFKDEEMKEYIEWHSANQPYFPVTPYKIEYRVSPERILELEKEDPEIDWSTCSRRWFKHVKNCEFGMKQ